MVFKIGQDIFETDVIFTIRQESLSDQCGNVVPYLFCTGT